MSKEEDAAFDDWQAQAEQAAFGDWEAEAQKEVEAPTQQEKKQIEETKPATDTKKGQETQFEKKPVDLPKTILQKIQEHKKITNEQFPSFYQKIKDKSTNDDIILSNQILKSDKDFIKFGKAVSERLNKQAEEEDLQTLQEGNLLLLLYEQLQWKNLESIKEKLKIVKKQKKDQEKQIKKQKQREEILKRFRKAAEQEEANRPKYETKVQDDIFEGAALINSKQVEDQRKNKQIKKVQAPPAEEDDDFM